jgi:antitoxin MazE
MPVAKWGNRLAIRLPERVVRKLKAGDDVAIDVNDERTFEIVNTPCRTEFIEQLRALRGTIPSDCKFDRLDANDR